MSFKNNPILEPDHLDTAVYTPITFSTEINKVQNALTSIMVNVKILLTSALHQRNRVKN